MYIEFIFLKNDKSDPLTLYAQSYSKEFQDEIEKYVCPSRLMDFVLNNENKGYTMVDGFHEYAKVNVIDVSSHYKQQLDDMLKKGFAYSYESVIKHTPHLDKYGGEISYNKRTKF